MATIRHWVPKEYNEKFKEWDYERVFTIWDIFKPIPKEVVDPNQIEVQFYEGELVTIAEAMSYMGERRSTHESTV